MKKTSIIDVARHAGVGIGTVSRVINGTGGVSEHTLQLVHQAMHDLSYTPLAAADRRGPKPRQNKDDLRPTGHVELVYQADLSLGLIDQQAPIYEQILEGIEQAIDQSGHRLETRPVTSAFNELPEPEQECIGRIYFGSSSSQIMPKNFSLHLPSVWVVGIPPIWYTGDVVFVDHLTVGKLAAREATRNGGKDCLFIGWSDDSGNNSPSARHDAFTYWVRALGGTCRSLIDHDFLVSNHVTNQIDPQVLANRLIPLLTQDRIPDVICVQADIFLPSLYAALHLAKIERNRFPTIITCNNEPVYRKNLSPRPIVIDILGKQLGMLTIELLFSRIANPDALSVVRSIRPMVLKGR